MSEPQSEQSAGVPVWEQLSLHVRRAGDAIAAAAPDDPHDRAEGTRYLARLLRWSLSGVADRPDPANPRIGWESPRIGGDNPDYRYGSAAISGRYTYRLTGEVGDAQRIGIGTYGGALGSPGGLRRTGYLTDADLAIGPDGRFEVVVSVERQERAWLPMDPDSNSLMIRQTVLDRTHRPATITIERIDGVGSPPPVVDPHGVDRAVVTAGAQLEGVVRQFLGWTEAFRQRPNEIHPLDPELLRTAQGDPGTAYFNGYFELDDHEALVVDVDVPPCTYWNLQVTNHWLESIDATATRTHLNHHTASAPEGPLRIVIAASDPGTADWIDTVGHRRGGIAARFVDAQGDVRVDCRVVPIAALATVEGSPS